MNHGVKTYVVVSPHVLTTFSIESSLRILPGEVYSMLTKVEQHIASRVSDKSMYACAYMRALSIIIDHAGCIPEGSIYAEYKCFQDKDNVIRFNKILNYFIQLEMPSISVSVEMYFNKSNKLIKK